MATSRVVFKPNVKGIGELQRSDGVRAEVVRRARNIAQAADQNAGIPGAYDVLDTTTKRARATAGTTNDAAVRSEAMNHTLTSAAGAARG